MAWNVPLKLISFSSDWKENGKSIGPNSQGQQPYPEQNQYAAASTPDDVGALFETGNNLCWRQPDGRRQRKQHDRHRQGSGGSAESNCSRQSQTTAAKIAGTRQMA